MADILLERPDGPETLIKLDFIEYRHHTDGLESMITDDGNPALPRTGIFEAEDYQLVVDDSSTRFSVAGMPVTALYRLAYPNYNKSYPELSGFDYSLVPAQTDEGKTLLNEVGIFTPTVAEIIIPKLIFGEYTHDEYDAVLATIAPRAYDGLCYDLGSLGIGSSAAPFMNDGAPLFHYAFSLDEAEKITRDQLSGGIGGRLVDTITDRDEILARSAEIAEQHIDSFSEHSRTATVVELDHKDNIRQMIEDPNWYVLMHINEDDQVDGSVMGTLKMAETPWLNPASLDQISNVVISVDNIGTSKEARNKGIGGHLLRYGLRSLWLSAQNDGKSAIVTFDTAATSNELIPRIAWSAIEDAGFSIKHVRADVISHAIILP